MHTRIIKRNTIHSNVQLRTLRSSPVPVENDPASQKLQDVTPASAASTRIRTQSMGEQATTGPMEHNKNNIWTKLHLSQGNDTMPRCANSPHLCVDRHIHIRPPDPQTMAKPRM